MLNKNTTAVLKLSFDDKKQKLILRLKRYEATKMMKFSTAWLDYVSDGQNITLIIDEIRYIPEPLRDMLQECLDGKLLKHESIEKAFGYYRNKIYQEVVDDSIVYVNNKQGTLIWVGAKNSLYPGGTGINSPGSFLYTDAQGRIFLELSKFYPWMFSDPEEDEIEESFEQWIERFKPDVVVEISRSVVKQWIQQIDVFLHRLDASNEKYCCPRFGCFHCIEPETDDCPCGNMKRNQEKYHANDNS